MNKGSIHPTACIESGAQLGEDVTVGPFCHIGPDVIVGDRSILMTGVVLLGETFIGENAQIYPHAILGASPQNNKHRGGKTRLEVGRNCIIREGVTMHCGSDDSSGRTVVGDDCMFLAYSHVAHDCVVGNHVTFANNVTIGGHVHVGDHVIIGGGAAVHQFVEVGHHAFIGGLAALVGDLIPYGMVVGVHAVLSGLNIIGMKRSNLARAEIHAMRHAFAMLFDRTKPVYERASDVLSAFSDFPTVVDMIGFVQKKRERALCTMGHVGNKEK